MLNRLRYLDRRLLVSGVCAILAALLLLLLIMAGPPEARIGSALGLILLLVLIQGVLLFYRPADRSPFGKAREAFIAGDFVEAAGQLETLVAARPNARGLTLLGNTYRQLGRLDDARHAIERALSLRPKDSYALYGMGRVELAAGQFGKASDNFRLALAAGAPPNVACDLGIAEYFAGEREIASQTLQKTTRLLRIEAWRQYMTNLILYQLVSDSEAAQVALANVKGSAEGRVYWETEAARYAGTPYGIRISAILANDA